jgi:hypothetical protein
MGPRPIHGLDLADNAFFKVKPALTPAENLRHGRFAFERTINGVPDRAMSEVNLAVAAALFESDTAAALAEAAHLQNLGGGKLVQVPDQGMTGIDAFRGSSTLGERRHELLKFFP